MIPESQCQFVVHVLIELQYQLFKLASNRFGSEDDAQSSDFPQDNEFGQDGYGNADYFVQIEDVLRTNGIVVPLTYNDPGERMSFINGTGAVDIYGCVTISALMIEKLNII